MNPDEVKYDGSIIAEMYQNMASANVNMGGLLSENNINIVDYVNILDSGPAHKKIKTAVDNQEEKLYAEIECICNVMHANKEKISKMKADLAELEIIEAGLKLKHEETRYKLDAITDSKNLYN